MGVNIIANKLDLHEIITHIDSNFGDPRAYIL